MIATVGASLYVFSFGLPIGWTSAILALALGMAATAWANSEGSDKWADSFHVRISVLLLAATHVVSCIFSTDPAQSLRLSISILPGLALFSIVTSAPPGDRGPSVVRASFVGVALLLTLRLVLTSLWIGGDSPFSWVTALRDSTFVVPNDTVLLAVAAPFVLTGAIASQRAHRIILASGAILAILLAIVLVRSRIALFALFAGLMTVALHQRRRASFVLLTLVLLIGSTFVVDVYCGGHLLRKLAQTTDARPGLWAASLETFYRHPWLGAGPRTFASQFASVEIQAHLHEWVRQYGHGGAPWTHNVYLEFLAEQGILGFATFMMCLVSGILSFRTKTSSASRAQREPAISGMAALVAFAVGGILELSFLREWVSSVFFLLLGLAVVSDPGDCDSNTEGANHEKELAA